MSASAETGKQPSPVATRADGRGARLGLYIRTVRSGQGAEKVIVNLAKGLARRGHVVDLLLEEPGGAVLDDLPPGVTVVMLEERGLDRVAGAFARLACLVRTLAAMMTDGRIRIPGLVPAFVRLAWGRQPPIHALSRYLRRTQPVSVTAFLNHPCLVLLLATPGKGTRLLVSVRNHVSTSSAHAETRWNREVPILMAALYRRADCVIANSEGVRADVERITGLAPEKTTTIHNPYFLDRIAERAAEPSGHPWLDGPDGPPVLLAAGKLRQQKGFPVLIRAFATVRRSRPVRLIILGEGADRDALTALAEDLGVADDIDMPGHVDNPYAYFGRAAAFVLSSAWEGFPNVLVEAMACGAPVVSTDCPSGPSEILAGGRYGPLVPVGDPAALADAIETVVSAPPDRAQMRERTRAYDSETILDAYEALLTDTETAVSR